MRRRGLRAAVAVLLAGTAAGAAASAPAVTVSAIPASIELCPGESRRVQVVVRNEGAEAVKDVRFSTFTTDAGAAEAAIALVEDRAAAMRADRLEPNGALLGTLTVSVRSHAPSTPVVAQLRAEYALAATPPASVRAVSLGTLEVRRPAPPATDALKAEVKGAPGALHEKDEGLLVLVLGNGSAGSLRVRAVHPTAAPHTRLAPQGALPELVTAQQAVTLAYKVTAEDRIVPGKYLGWFDVEVEAPASCGAVLHRLATFDTTLGVTGESELLKLVDVPSLLFLPGFLVLAVGMLLWKVPRLWPRFLLGPEVPKLGFKDVEFWLFGITISLLITALAPGIAIVGDRRAYDLHDIVRLWTFSLLVGVGLVALALVADRGVAAWWRATRALRPEDDPLSTIAKMARKGRQPGECPAVEVKDASPPVRGFRLWEEASAENAWVIPGIRCVRLADDFESALLDADIRELSRALREASRAGRCRLEWALADLSPLRGPAVYPSAKLVPAQATKLIRMAEETGP